VEIRGLLKRLYLWIGWSDEDRKNIPKIYKPGEPIRTAAASIEYSLIFSLKLVAMLA
jgi:hypothetical protein